MQNTTRNVSIALLSTVLLAGVNSAHAETTVERGTKYEYSDFLETLDNGEKFVGRKLLTYKKTWDTEKDLGQGVVNWYADVGTGFGQYRGGRKNNPDEQYSRKELEATLSTEHRLTVGIEKNGFKPEVGIAGKALIKRINHRVELGVDAVAGVSYKKDDIKVGARYHHNLVKKFHYPHGGTLNDQSVSSYTLDQSGGNSATVFFEKQSTSGKTHGVEIGWQENPKGEVKDHGAWGSYEPKSRQYSLAYYFRF